jgi:ketosteroid isomerase-like protein
MQDRNRLGITAIGSCSTCFYCFGVGAKSGEGTGHKTSRALSAGIRETRYGKLHPVLRGRCNGLLPQPEPAGRFDGKEAIKTHFEQVFAAIRRTSTRSTPPFHRLIPEDLRVQLLGDSSAVVTFRLSNADRIARRTLVLEKLGNAWFIVHVHASNVPVLRQSPAPKTVKPAQAHEERTPN